MRHTHKVRGAGAAEAVWNQTSVLKANEASKASEAIGVVGVEFRKNQEDLAVREVAVPRDRAAKVPEDPGAETKNCHSFRANTQTIPRIRL